MRSPPSVSPGGRRGSGLLAVKAEVMKLCRGTPPFWSHPEAGAAGLGGAGVREAAGVGCGWWCLGPGTVQGEGSHLAGRVDAVCGAPLKNDYFLILSLGLFLQKCSSPEPLWLHGREGSGSREGCPPVPIVPALFPGSGGGGGPAVSSERQSLDSLIQQGEGN